jgi:1,2-phenylacetyl-CoA epoxidase PaaB subunit
MKVYRVRVYYREPTYEERAGSKDKPYRGAFTVEAQDEREAREKALEEFKRVERLSGVGWVRDVTKVDVEEV